MKIKVKPFEWVKQDNGDWVASDGSIGGVYIIDTYDGIRYELVHGFFISKGTIDGEVQSYTSHICYTKGLDSMKRLAHEYHTAMILDQLILDEN